MRVRLSFAALFGSAALLALIVLLSRPQRSISVAISALPLALAVSAPFALVAAAARIVSPAGALAGLIVSSTLLAGAGWPAWLQLGMTMAATTLATGLGRARNTRSGLLDDRDGRGWGSILANTGLAACAALFARDAGLGDVARLAIASVLITGASDTAASEIGKAWSGHEAFYVFPVRRVPAGTPGAITIMGTLAGTVSAAVMALFAHTNGLIRAEDIIVVALAAVVASLIESFVSRALELRGWLDNDGVNLAATGTGALLAVGLHPFLS